ncbi:uncharacterized protein LOC100368219 [Saccoglossus kowalevskii]|uniref:Uncharacterized protein LOC100368219 n=1 Tax=Saccoglossus kowalevskii TaxID=10224 RepID=A0ABM0GLR2_SACKO|nr:PREDICTED: uncharacterized protein LOC100368219 [Saccoglossus kowalevskii]
MKTTLLLPVVLLCLFYVVKTETSISNNDLESTGCDCNSTSCGCCADLIVEKIELNTSVCMNISYLPEEIGFSFIISLGGDVVYNETISVKNPPPICFGVPYMKQYFSLCLEFYNMDYSTTSLSGCAKIEAMLYAAVVESVDLGCFKIPPGKDIKVMTMVDSKYAGMMGNGMMHKAMGRGMAMAMVNGKGRGMREHMEKLEREEQEMRMRVTGIKNGRETQQGFDNYIH